MNLFLTNLVMEFLVLRGRSWFRPTTIWSSAAPSPAKSRAGDSKPPPRTKPKGFAPEALCYCSPGPPTVLQGKVSEVSGKRRGPPTEMQGKCRRCRAKEGYLRRKCGESVGGVGQKRGTSDGNARKVSEVPGKREGPPTDSRGICRRSFGC